MSTSSSNSSLGNGQHLQPRAVTDLKHGNGLPPTSSSKNQSNTAGADKARKPRRYHTLPLSDLDDTDGSDNECNIEMNHTSSKLNANAGAGLKKPSNLSSPKISAEHAAAGGLASHGMAKPSKENMVHSSVYAPSNKMHLAHQRLVNNNGHKSPRTQSPSRRHHQHLDSLGVHSKQPQPQLNPTSLRIFDSGDETDTDDCGPQVAKGTRKLWNHKPTKLRNNISSSSASSLGEPRYHFDRRKVVLTVDTSDKTIGRPPATFF